MSALDEVIGRYIYEHGNTPVGSKACVELADLRARIAELEAETVSLHHVISECEDYLKSMVEQYCRHSSGENRYCHDFMSAGECTFEYLVARGLAEYTENGVDIRLKVKE